MKQVHIPLEGIRYRHYALLSSPTEVVKQGETKYGERTIPIETIRDYHPGLYGFQSVQSRDKFVSRMNASNELRPCVAVLLQGL